MFNATAHRTIKEARRWSIPLRSALVLVILGQLTMPYDSLAEKVECPPGQSCETDLITKISNSLDSAEYVFVGEITKGPAPGSQFDKRVGDPTGLVGGIEFSVLQTLRGESGFERLALELPVRLLAVDASDSRGSTGPYLTGIDSALFGLEQKLEQGQLTRKEYTEKLERLFSVSPEPAGESADFLVARVRPGALDSPYRDSLVAARVGEPVVMFVFKRLRSSGKVTLFPNEFDLYPIKLYEEELADTLDVDLPKTGS